MPWDDFLVTPLVGALAGFVVWYFQSRLDAIRRAQERLNDDRRRVYTEILEPFVRIFAGIKNPKENQKALQQVLSVEYKRTAFQFNLIGSDAVVRSFNRMMQYIYSNDPELGGSLDPVELVRLWGDFLLEIRKDVGNPKTKLTGVDMLRSQIKDIDRMLESESL
jgi:hypothetical protein